MRDIWTDFAVKSYDIFLRNWNEYRRLAQKSIEAMDEAKTVLDDGCGTGIIALALAETKNVVGIDKNPAMIEKAKLVLDEVSDEDHYQGNLILSVGDALDLHFDDNSVDGIVANNVIFNVDKPELMVQEAYRVLNSGGTFSVSGPQPHFNPELIDNRVMAEFKHKGIYDFLKEEIEQFKNLQYELSKSGILNTYSIPEVTELLLDTGFKEVLETDNTIYYNHCFFAAAKK
jgi:ubiquinone/menaquinone biosynthesis C-methylase UbiE